MGKRICRICDFEGNKTEFPLAGVIKGITYYRHLCKHCYHESKKPRRQKLKDWYFELKKTLSCENCGNNDFRVLEFDHIDPTKKIFQY